VVLPDATVVSARAIAKITGRERGHRGVIERLGAAGAPRPDNDADLTDWLRGALRTVHATRLRHPGNHRYAVGIGSRGQRTRTLIGLARARYPKPSGQTTLFPDGSRPEVRTR
jgi:hypothetical protein